MKEIVHSKEIKSVEKKRNFQYGVSGMATLSLIGGVAMTVVPALMLIGIAAVVGGFVGLLVSMQQADKRSKEIVLLRVSRNLMLTSQSTGVPPTKNEAVTAFENAQSGIYLEKSLIAIRCKGT